MKLVTYSTLKNAKHTFIRKCMDRRLYQLLWWLHELLNLSKKVDKSKNILKALHVWSELFVLYMYLVFRVAVYLQF
jgi:hypothetical protein